NRSDGVEIFNGQRNTIGGSTPGARNVISGNAGNGIFIDQFPNLSAAGNAIFGNFIGTTQDGLGAIPNPGNGVALIAGSSNLIGGTTLAAGVGMIGGTETPASIGNGAGNLISGNAQWGIQITLSGSTGSSPSAPNFVQGNYIGMDVRGAAAV